MMIFVITYIRVFFPSNIRAGTRAGRVEVANILLGEYCKHFAGWMLLTFAWLKLLTFCWENAANILQGGCCKHFTGWMLQTFCRVDAANILQGGCCKHFTGWMLQTFCKFFFSLTHSFMNRF